MRSRLLVTVIASAILIENVIVIIVLDCDCKLVIACDRNMYNRAYAFVQNGTILARVNVLVVVILFDIK